MIRAAIKNNYDSAIVKKLFERNYINTLTMRDRYKDRLREYYLNCKNGTSQ